MFGAPSAMAAASSKHETAALKIKTLAQKKSFTEPWKLLREL